MAPVAAPRWFVDRNITPHVPVYGPVAPPRWHLRLIRFHGRSQEHNTYVAQVARNWPARAIWIKVAIVLYSRQQNNCSRCSLKPRSTTATVAENSPQLLTKMSVTSARLWPVQQPFEQWHRERGRDGPISAHEAHAQAQPVPASGLSSIRDGVLLDNRAEPTTASPKALPCPRTYQGGCHRRRRWTLKPERGRARTTELVPTPTG